MSAQNGDRARFHRNRKRRVLQRMRLKAALQAIKEEQTGSAANAAPARIRGGPALAGS